MFPLATVVLVLGGRWDSLVPTACGAVLMVAAAAVGSAWWRRQVAAAQRWVADPPGPLRDAPAATRLDRWTSGRGLLWPVLALVVAGVGAGLLAALLA